MIGGTLAQPVKRFPKVFRSGTLWEIYPFLLPNIIVAALFSVGGLLAFFLLQETHSKFSNRTDPGTQTSEFLEATFRRCLPRTQFVRAEQSEDIEGLIDSHRTRQNEGEASVELGRLCSSDEFEASRELPTSHQSPYSNQIIFQVVSVSMLAFHKVSSDLLIPMFLATPLVVSKGNGELHSELLGFVGGFGMSTAQIGNVLLTQAVAAIIFQKFAIPHIVAKWGPLRTYRVALHLFPCLYLFTPFTVRLPYLLGLFALLLDLWTKTLLVGLGYNSSAIL